MVHCPLPTITSFIGAELGVYAATKIDKDSVLQLPCDILVPAAIGGVITEDNADQVDCKFVVEAANGPTTPGGDAQLRERGIVVLPDIYTNGGQCVPSCCSASFHDLKTQYSI